MIPKKKLAYSYSKLSINDLYLTLGYNSYFKKPIRWQRGKPVMYAPPGVGLGDASITLSPAKARTKGRRIYKKYDTKLKKIICQKLQWCKNSKKIGKNRKHLATTLVGIPAVCALFPPSAPYLAGGAIIIPIFLHVHKNLDKLCKCKKDNNE